MLLVDTNGVPFETPPTCFTLRDQLRIVPPYKRNFLDNGLAFLPGRPVKLQDTRVAKRDEFIRTAMWSRRRAWVI